MKDLNEDLFCQSVPQIDEVQRTGKSGTIAQIVRLLASVDKETVEEIYVLQKAIWARKAV